MVSSKVSNGEDRQTNQSATTKQSSETFRRACSWYRVDPNCFPLPRNEMLHIFRLNQEKGHHLRISQSCASQKWLLNSGRHEPVDLDHTSTLDAVDASNACNRTAAVYLLRDAWDPRRRRTRLPHVSYTGVDEMTLIAAELFQYTWRRWFRPYKSEIDRGQFLTKVNVPSAATDLPIKTCSLAMVDQLKLKHTNFCDRVRDTMANEIIYGQLRCWDGSQKRQRPV